MAWLENTSDPDAPKARTDLQNGVECSNQTWGGQVFRGSEGNFEYNSAGDYLLFAIGR